MKVSNPLKIAAAAVAIALFASNPASAAGVTISGDGSSFAMPLLNACKTAWQDATKNTFGSYPGNGSGTGRGNSDKGLGDFNFTDAIHTTAKATVLHIPVVAAPIAITYNLPSKTQRRRPKRLLLERRLLVARSLEAQWPALHQARWRNKPRKLFSASYGREDPARLRRSACCCLQDHRRRQVCNQGRRVAESVLPGCEDAHEPEP